MQSDLDFKIELLSEYLNNGGVETIPDAGLLEDLLKVKWIEEGRVNPETVSSRVRAFSNALVAMEMSPPLLSNDYVSEYRTFVQKSLYFDQTNIETEKDFDEVFNEFHNRQDVLFRGLNEAKYRLYSSLQRFWITSPLKASGIPYTEFLRKLVDNARTEQGNMLVNYLSNTGFDPENDLAVLSFLQHYRCPTPLLDWTYSFANALYFATEKIEPPTGNRKIENYFGIYFLEEKYLDKSSMKEMIEKGLVENRHLFQEGIFENMRGKGFSQEQIEQTFPDEYIKDFFILIHGRGAITFASKIERLMEFPILYFSDFKRNFKLHYYLNNNLNIVNQQGVFTWNSNPTKPLEHVANAEYADKSNEDNYRFSECININKALAPYVKAKLEDIGVNKGFIYPDPYEFAANIFTKVVS